MITITTHMRSLTPIWLDNDCWHYHYPPLPPPPPYDHLRPTPPRPPAIAPPTQTTILPQESPLPESLDSDDFFLPEPDESDYDAESNADSTSDYSLASTTPFPSLSSYDDMDDLDELNFSDLSDLEEDTPPRCLLIPPGPGFPYGTPPVSDTALGTEGFNQQAFPQVV